MGKRKEKRRGGMSERGGGGCGDFIIYHTEGLSLLVAKGRRSYFFLLNGGMKDGRSPWRQQ